MVSSMEKSGTVCAVVVTFNRKALLRRCLMGLLQQTRPVDQVLVVDNASTDGTAAMVAREFGAHGHIAYVDLGANLGGGGGFHHGARRAFVDGHDWVWLMDDDCLATPDCLDALVRGARDRRNVYSPIILSIENKQTVLWGIKAACHSGNQVTATLPFNGFMVHRDTLEAIGLPEKRFFIYGDDTEFNMRARASGRQVVLVTDSVMYHPHKNNYRGLKVYKMFRNRLWVYYKLRNAILIYRRYGYHSRNQIIMFAAAFGFFVLTLDLRLMRLWLAALADGINGRLYVRQFN
jgi:rhamnopyranosyl-N-acetylglucosaminyl-diphospho-decaprenol beta-1,3/1,4-galactofuranosyltransferase